jgi:hypothetical protein
MYRNSATTPVFPEFGLPFEGGLDPENRWVKKAVIISWAIIKTEYLKHFSGSTTGAPRILPGLPLAPC